MKTILEILQLSTEYLEQRSIASPRREAEELLSIALNIPRLELYLQFDRPLSEEELKQCRRYLKRRGSGEPLQQIEGKVVFANCTINVTPDVLIPRPETEQLVVQIIEELQEHDLKGKALWDICTGSGCIAIALKKALPALHVVASDLSSQALAVARQNGTANGVEVEWLEGDLLTPFGGRKTDFIVCNPPYIAEGELPALPIEVREHEPRQALIAGPTGLEIYQRLAQALPTHLHPGGRIWLELGVSQGPPLKQLFGTPPWHNVTITEDLSGHDRFLTAVV